MFCNIFRTLMAWSRTSSLKSSSLYYGNIFTFWFVLVSRSCECIWCYLKKTARLFGMRIINWEGCKCELMKTEFDVHIQREYMLTPTEEGLFTLCPNAVQLNVWSNEQFVAILISWICKDISVRQLKEANHICIAK